MTEQKGLISKIKAIRADNKQKVVHDLYLDLTPDKDHRNAHNVYKRHFVKWPTDRPMPMLNSEYVYACFSIFQQLKQIKINANSDEN